LKSINVLSRAGPPLTIFAAAYPGLTNSHNGA
jgi:hypothetical protein